MRNGAAMAQKVETLFVDDIDGSAAQDTIQFGLDGTRYEIDLNADHVRELRAIFSRYSQAGRKVTGASRRGSPARRKASADGAATDVRNWAKAHGIKVKDRGRVPADVLAQYRAAVGK
jgi:nucleoid-associated protein Lsr2